MVFPFVKKGFIIIFITSLIFTGVFKIFRLQKAEFSFISKEGNINPIEFRIIELWFPFISTILLL